ncbi:glycosyltransferase family 2 protein [Aquimarina sp. Aq78]|uniref:glycosyltransferase n=1 Tax=Aquimarina sp. Aq78 TaxID=1191889 RepID=UPI000D114BCC|nr:glycosyltransferase [Aquimarina sp. Aq78]
MNISIIIPAHNEERFIEETLDSLVSQTLLPKKIVVVNDNSTDNTVHIINKFTDKYHFISLVNITNSSKDHMPGSKVINAFYQGFQTLDSNYDIICKFDADLIFQKDYLKTIAEVFESDSKIGMASGILYIEKKKKWIYEHIADKNHVRGPIKAYRKECFEAINGLKKSIGWDTLDVLLAQYHGWKTKTCHSLIVKHLKPTGKNYNTNTKYVHGEAMYKMRYGLWITLIASIKLALLKKRPSLINDYLTGYYKAKAKKEVFLVSEKEGDFIRKLRWKKMKKKLI